MKVLNRIQMIVSLMVMALTIYLAAVILYYLVVSMCHVGWSSVATGLFLAYCVINSTFVDLQFFNHRFKETGGNYNFLKFGKKQK